MTVLGLADRPQWEKKNCFILNSIAHHQMPFQKPERTAGMKFLQFSSGKYLVQTVSSETSPSKEDISFPAGDIIPNLALLYLCAATSRQPIRFALKDISTLCQYH